MLTTAQIKARTKTVTRRLNWKNLKPGERLRAVEKSQGLKKGEKIKILCEIEVVDVRRERLDALIDDLHYGFNDVEKEGFGMEANTHINGYPSIFIQFFCQTHKGCTPQTEVTRIEFKYV